MSDIKLYAIKEKQLKNAQKLTEKQMRELVIRYMESLLGLRLLAEDFSIDPRNNEKIETLCLDENYQLVIIEYRCGKFGKIINKGLVFADYIKQNPSIFKMLVTEKFGSEIVQNVNYNPRLVIIGDNFNRYDEHAIQQIHTVIDLIQIALYDKNYLVLEKKYQSMQVDHSKFHHTFKDAKEKSIYQTISRFVLSLGDEVMELGRDDFLVYRKVKSFMYVSLLDEIELTLIFQNKIARAVQKGDVYTKTYKIKTENDFLKIQDEVEISYDQN